MDEEFTKPKADKKVPSRHFQRHHKNFALTCLLLRRFRNRSESSFCGFKVSSN